MVMHRRLTWHVEQVAVDAGRRNPCCRFSAAMTISARVDTRDHHIARLLRRVRFVAGGTLHFLMLTVREPAHFEPSFGQLHFFDAPATSYIPVARHFMTITTD